MKIAQFRLTRCRLEWKLQDLWVGVFWKTTHATTDEGRVPAATDVWICVVACLPLHVTLWREIAVLAEPRE